MDKTKRIGVALDLKDAPELYEALNRYRTSVGWTWRRLVLTGVGDLIARRGDSPDLVLTIANYLSEKR